MLRRCFRAMGTDIELALDGDDSTESWTAMARAEREIERLERMLSRFIEGSDLSRLNLAGCLVAPPELAQIVITAMGLRGETGGLFDPTVHDAMLAAGYDRPFDTMPPEDLRASLAPAEGGGAVACDPASGFVMLGAGTRLDLGGIAKGFAADRAADLLGEIGPCVVNLGGEVVVRGGPWPIGIESDTQPLGIALVEGAVATSGRDRRRWTRGGREHHHVIDPRTGRPADTDLLRATVIAADGARADALATALLVAGRDRALAMVERLGLAAILQTPDGVIDSRLVVA